MSLWSIRHKIMLLMASIAFFIGDAINLRHSLVRESEVLAKVVGDNCTGALSFNDPATAYDILKALQFDENIVYGAVYDASGQLFAEYQPPAAVPHLPLPARGISQVFVADRLQLIRPITLDNEEVGSIYLERSLSELSQRLQQYFWLAASVLLGATVASFLISLFLQRHLSDPIRHLATLANEVSRTSDYTLRAKVEGADELGLLARVFNQMLVEIERRDQELQAAQAHLEARVADLTTELRSEVMERLRAQEALRLSQEQLLQAQKMEAIGRLAGGVAHDFNNQLTVILGLSEMLLMRLKNDEACYGYVQTILKSARKSAALTRQLLAFGRKQILQPRVLDLNAMLQDMEGTLKRLLTDDMTLEMTLASHLGQVNVDPVQLDQVVMNLVINARDAVGRGGRIQVETTNYELRDGAELGDPTLRPGPFVILRVSDNGQGIAPEVMSRLFEPFFTTKAPDKGTGLGLATVFGIVKQSGGHIQVTSTLGKGARFTIYLPQAKGPIGVVTTELTRKQLGQGRASILLVEDDEQVRHMIMDTLQANGYTVLEAANAGEAVMLAEDEKLAFDLLLTDIIMPRVNGRELACVFC
jgi:signal transduction histidine kinase